MSEHSAEKDVRCDGHYGAGSLREWAECPLCNPGESSVLPPGEWDDCGHHPEWSSKNECRHPGCVTPPEVTQP